MSSRPAFYSINDNQNHFMNDGKTSSRVLQQPGGTSSVCLEWDDNNSSGKDVWCIHLSWYDSVKVVENDTLREFETKCISLESFHIYSNWRFILYAFCVKKSSSIKEAAKDSTSSSTLSSLT